jgi:flagellar biosynthesis protein FliP
MGGALLASLLAALFADAHFAEAFAQDISISFGNGQDGGGGVTERAIQLIAIITVLSLAPAILVMVTSFTRIVVVLSLLRTAIGLQTAPPNAVIISLALFLTGFVMAPAFQTAYDNAVQPLVAGEIEPDQAFERGAAPFRDFMCRMCARRTLRCLWICRARSARKRPRRRRCAFSCPPS